MLTRSIIRELHTKSVHFVPAYTQADAKSDIFMGIPKGFGDEVAHPREWVIILDESLYGLIDTGLVWFEISRKVWSLKGLSNHECTPVYGIYNRWSLSFMLTIV